MSIVDHINLLSISSSATLQIGDSSIIAPISMILAVQREYELFFSDEGDFGEYTVFSRPIPQPTITEHVRMNRINESPVIKVHHIDIFGAAASSVVHIGSTKRITSEARVKHIRQLLD
jgi:spore germination protein PE